jgi:hypothetical protein
MHNELRKRDSRDTQKRATEGLYSSPGKCPIEAKSDSLEAALIASSAQNAGASRPLCSLETALLTRLAIRNGRWVA